MVHSEPWIYRKSFCGKICARRGFKGVTQALPFPFSAYDSSNTNVEMTCNPFQTELTSHSNSENNLFETVSLAVDRLSRPCGSEKTNAII